MKLNEICEVYSGYALKSFNDVADGLPVVKIGNILTDGTLNLEECQYTTDIVNEKYYSNKGDIYIALSGATTGKIGIMNTDDKYIINQRVGIVRQKSKDIPQEYIKYFLLRETDRILQDAMGCAQPNISPKRIAEYIVPDISKEDMRKVCEILNKIKGIIDSRKKEIIHFDELVRGRFVEMFGDPYINEFGWKKIKIKNAVTVEPQNGMYKPQSDYVTDGSGIPILRIDGFYDGIVTDFSSLKRLKCSENERKKYLLYEDDVVINRVNSIEYLGKCAHINGLLEDTVYESNMMRMHFDSTRFHPVYVCRLLCSRFVYDQIVNHAKQAVNQASINQKDVLDFEIYEPPLKLQTKFSDFVYQVNKSKLIVQKELDETQLLFDSLMQEYFG